MNGGEAQGIRCSWEKKSKGQKRQKVKKFLVEVCIDEFGFEEWREELETIDREKYKENGGNFWIALDNKKEVIGTIGLENISNGVGMLKTMYVHKEYRGYKVAQKLMEDLTNFAVNNNFKKIDRVQPHCLARSIFFLIFLFFLKHSSI